MAGFIQLVFNKALVEKYIASLPDNGTREKVSYTLECADGNIANYFDRAMMSPKTSVYATFTGDMPYSVTGDLMLNMLGDIMRIRYTESLREEEGGTYGASVDAYLSMFNGEWAISYQFATNAQQRDKLIEIANQELANVINNGANEADFAKVKEAAIKQHENNLRTNGYWLSVLNDRAMGKDSYTGFDEKLRNLSLDEFNAFIKHLDITTNHATVVMTGVAK